MSSSSSIVPRDSAKTPVLPFVNRIAWRIVITPELPAIHNAIRAIEYLTGLHYPGDNIDIVLNRYSRRTTLDDREIEASLRRPIAVRVPNNYAQIVTAINAGIPIDRARKSDLPAAFDAWADRLVGDEAA